MFLVVSNDNGTTWSAPKMIYPPGSGQIDVQVKVDPVDGKTVYASWLQNNKSVIGLLLRAQIQSLQMTAFVPTAIIDARLFGFGLSG